MRSSPGSGALLVLVALAANVACRPQGDVESFRLGLLVHEPRGNDRQTLAGVRLAVDQANTAGGIEVGLHRLAVELVVEDCGTTPEQAVDAARRLLFQREVPAFVGPSLSRDAVPVAEVAEQAGIPMISPASTHPNTTAGKRFAFRVGYSDDVQARALARFALHHLGATTAAVLYDATNVYNRGLAEVFRAAFSAGGGEVVASLGYVSGESDFTPRLERIAALRPAVLVLPNYLDDTLVQAEQARELGLDAVLLGADGWLEGPAPNHEELEGGFFSALWHPRMLDTLPEASRFGAAFREAYGRSPAVRDVISFDAAALLLRAAEDAGTTEPRAIRDALAAIAGYRGASGTITFRGHGGDPVRDVLILAVRDGEDVVDRTISSAEFEDQESER